MCNSGREVVVKPAKNLKYSHPTQPNYQKKRIESTTFRIFFCNCAYFFVPLRPNWIKVYNTKQHYTILPNTEQY